MTAIKTRGGHNSLRSTAGIISGITVRCYLVVTWMTGRQAWRVKAERFTNPWIAIGICHSNIGGGDEYMSSWSLSSRNQKYRGNGRDISSVSGDWRDGDVIEVVLDCINSSLNVTNERTGKGENWALPRDGMPWHLYVNLYADS